MCVHGLIVIESDFFQWCRQLSRDSFFATIMVHRYCCLKNDDYPIFWFGWNLTLVGVVSGSSQQIKSARSHALGCSSRLPGHSVVLIERTHSLELGLAAAAAAAAVAVTSPTAFSKYHNRPHSRLCETRVDKKERAETSRQHHFCVILTASQIVILSINNQSINQ